MWKSQKRQNLPSSVVKHVMDPTEFRADRETCEQEADLTKPVVVSGAAGRLGLQGMGGIGKSVLASALAHRPEVRRAFPDGVYWITLGQEISSPTLVKYCPGGLYGRRTLHPQV
jgi:NB-ARC domain